MTAVTPLGTSRQAMVELMGVKMLPAHARHHTRTETGRGTQMVVEEDWDPGVPSPSQGLLQGSRASWRFHPQEAEPSVWLTPPAHRKELSHSGQLA